MVIGDSDRSTTADALGFCRWHEQRRVLQSGGGGKRERGREGRREGRRPRTLETPRGCREGRGDTGLEGGLMGRRDDGLTADVLRGEGGGRRGGGGGGDGPACLVRLLLGVGAWYSEICALGGTGGRVVRLGGGRGHEGHGVAEDGRQRRVPVDVAHDLVHAWGTQTQEKGGEAGASNHRNRRVLWKGGRVGGVSTHRGAS